jgi:O-antigen ligase
VLAFRALMAFTFILILAPQSFIPALRPLRIALLAAVVGVTARLVDCILRRQPLTVKSREMALTAGLVAWALITLPLSYWPGGSAAFLFENYLKTVAVFWLLGNVVDTLPRLRTVAWGLTCMAVPLALAGIENFASGAFLEVNQNVRRIEGYEAGLTANPNDFALMLNVILPLTVALLVASRSWTVRMLLAAVVILQAAGVVVTFSRGGFLTLAALCAVYLWRLVRGGRLFWAAAALAVVLVSVNMVPAGYLGRLATITDVDSDPTGSSQARWRDIAAAVRVVADNPLAGAGIGMNIIALNEVRGPAWVMVHNVYLEYAADLGVPGLVMFMLLMFSCLKRVRRVRREAASRPGLEMLSTLAGGVEVALLGFAVAAFFYPVAYHLYFYYLAGLAVAAGALYDRAAGTAAAVGPRPAVARAS